jgi:hypothetical protein
MEAISSSCCDDHQASADTSVSILDAYFTWFNLLQQHP